MTYASIAKCVSRFKYVLGYCALLHAKTFYMRTSFNVEDRDESLMSDDSNFEDFDELIRQLDIFYKKLSKKLSKQLRELEDMAEREAASGEWDIQTFDKPGIKGFIAKRKFGDTKAPRLNFPKEILEEEVEPLIDVFEDRRTLRIYIELPGLNKEEIELTIFDGKLEVKAGGFYKIIILPSKKINCEKARAKYKNGVLKIRIPKLGILSRQKEGTYKIKIE